jgi:hypothetical protein
MSDQYNYTVASEVGRLSLQAASMVSLKNKWTLAWPLVGRALGVMAGGLRPSR